MNALDEVCRRLPAVLHAVMTLLTVPYVLLAVFFVIVGRVASQHGLWAMFNTLLDALNWTMTWGFAILGIAFVGILAAGFFEPLRWWATLALAGMISVSLGILLYYRGSLPNADELFYLAPAILILVTTLWTLIRRQ